jgi:hypothetical protein
MRTLPAAHRGTPARITRRHFFRECGVGVGKIALASILTDAFASRPAFAAGVPAGAGGPKGTHFAPKAKRSSTCSWPARRVSSTCSTTSRTCSVTRASRSAPSITKGQRYAFIRADAAVLGPRYEFAKHGQSGAEISEILPHLAGIADDICVIRSVKTDQFNHAPRRSS